MSTLLQRPAIWKSRSGDSVKMDIPSPYRNENPMHFRGFFFPLSFTWFFIGPNRQKELFKIMQGHKVFISASHFIDSSHFS